MVHFSSFNDRIMKEADYMISHNCTIRDVAAWSGITKSTVHLDLTVRLQRRDKVRYEKVQAILKVNWDDKHVRGGKATKKSFESMTKPD